MLKNLPQQYKKLWNKCKKLLKNARQGDLEHAEETVKLILNYKGDLKFDPEIAIPVAMMHDIGHIAILPEHFKFITGPEKILNSKLVHMLAGAKITKEILKKVGYANDKIQEIAEIISIHDFDQLKDMDLNKIYDTDNKKFFHDIDGLDRYTEKRLEKVSNLYTDRGKLLQILEEGLKLFFYDEFRERAKTNFKNL